MSARRIISVFVGIYLLIVTLILVLLSLIPFNPASPMKASVDSTKLMEIGLTQVSSITNYMFLAAAGLIGIIVNKLLLRESNTGTPNAPFWCILAILLFSMISMTCGGFTCGFLVKMSMNGATSISAEVAWGTVFQWVSLMIAVTFLVFVLVSIKVKEA